MLVSGGKSIYGARIGILMLEAQFPRIPGDMGNAETWPFPVLYKIVRGATPDRVVRKNAEGTLDRFIAAAEELVSDGADACLLYTSPSPRDQRGSRMPSSA